MEQSSIMSSTELKNHTRVLVLKGGVWSDLLQCEDVLVKVILQLFISIVNAELFEAVGLKVLKAKDVQNAYGQTLQAENRYKSIGSNV